MHVYMHEGKLALEKRSGQYVRVVVYLPRALSDYLDNRANKVGLSRSEIVRNDILAAEKLNAMRLAE